MPEQILREWRADLKKQPQLKAEASVVYSGEMHKPYELRFRSGQVAIVSQYEKQEQALAAFDCLKNMHGGFLFPSLNLSSPSG